MHRKALGRGLGALIAGVDAADEAGAVLQLSPAMIKPNPYQPRRKFPRESIASLARSLKAHGMLQPLLVRPVEDGYELIAGERRLRAAQEVGLPLVPAMVEKADDNQMLLMALVENLQREDLGPLEEAAAFQELADRFELSHGEIGEQVGRDRSTVANAVRLLKLPEEVRSFLASGRISAGHARALLAVDDPQEQLALAREIVRDALSVREAESRSRRRGKAGPARAAATPQGKSSPEMASLEARLKGYFGTKVVIRENWGKGGTGEGGKLEIDYYSQEDLSRIIDLLGVSL